MQVLAHGYSVNQAIDNIFEPEDSDEEDVDVQQHASHTADTSMFMDIPTGASQSSPVPQPDSALGSQQGRRPPQARPPVGAPVPHHVSYADPINVDSLCQAEKPSQPWRPNLEHPSTSRQGSGSLGGALGQAGSSGAANLSRLGASGQSKASSCSRQVCHMVMNVHQFVTHFRHHTVYTGVAMGT